MAGVLPTPATPLEGNGEPTPTNCEPTRYPVIVHHVPDPPGNVPIRRPRREYRQTPPPAGNPPTILLRQLLNPPLNSEERIQFFMRQHEKTMKEANSALTDLNSGPYYETMGGCMGTPSPDWVRRFNNMAINGRGDSTDGQFASGPRGSSMPTVTFRHEGFASCLPSSSAPSDGDGYQLQIVTTVGNQYPPPMIGCRKKLNARSRGECQFQQGPIRMQCMSGNPGPHQNAPRPYPGVKRSSQSSMHAAMHFERILGSGEEENLVKDKMAIMDGFGGIAHTSVVGGVAQFWNMEPHWATTPGVNGGHVFPFPAHSSFLLEREKWNHARFRCELCGKTVATPFEIHSHRWEHPYERMMYTEVTISPTDFPVVRRQECPYIPCVEKRITESRRRPHMI